MSSGDAWSVSPPGDIPPGSIFINYRRSEEFGVAHALYLYLEPVFSADRLFMAVEGQIKPGDDYVEILRSQVAACDVLIAMIGPRWLDIADEDGRRRLDDPEDFVRVEIVSALDEGKRVIPVLVGGAPIPSTDQLPEPLKPLSRRQKLGSQSKAS